MIDKHVLCRFGVSVAFIAFVCAMGYLFISGVGTIVNFISLFLSTISFLFFPMGISIFFIPTIFFYILWYIQTNANTPYRHEDFLIALLILISFLNAIVLVFTVIPTYAERKPVLDFTIWYVIPLATLILSIVFYEVYNTIGKKACKLIYGKDS